MRVGTSDALAHSATHRGNFHDVVAMTETWKIPVLGVTPNEAKRALLQLGGVVAWWCASWLAIGPSMEPGGAVFAVYVLLFVAAFAGKVVARFPPMPPLLGQLVAGFVLRNVPGLDEAVGEAVDARCSSAMRTAALGVILVRAGLSLDVAAVYRLRWPASRLAFAPSTAEALTVALLAKPALDLPWTYCAVLGFLFAAISPAVVIPSLLNLQEKGYGVKAGVPALVVTAASVDVVYSIAGFGVCAGFLVTARGGANAAAWKAPVQIAAGAALGYLAGTALGAITPPDKDASDDTEEGMKKGRGKAWEVTGETPGSRASWLLGISLLILFAGAEAEMTGGAALAVIVASAAAAREWGAVDAKACGSILNGLWNDLAQPLLFALIGAAVDVSRLSGDEVGAGIGLLAAGLCVRGLVAFLAAGGGQLAFSERVFVAVAWMPKATVQAALAGLPLDAAIAHEGGAGGVETKRAEVILALGVLAILITAPLGAAAVAVSGERLLVKAEADDEESNGEINRR